MSLRELPLLASENNWRLFTLRKSDKAFFAFQSQVYLRDHYTCQYCGFCTEQFLEVVNADGNYYDNHTDNLVTTCPLCAQCCFLESVGQGDFGGGTLIYLPEMTQSALNALCHVLFTAMALNDASAVQARNIYRGFRLRSQSVEKVVGERFSQPAVLGRVLAEKGLNGLNTWNRELSEVLRLLPDPAAFAAMVGGWVNTAIQTARFSATLT